MSFAVFASLFPDRFAYLWSLLAAIVLYLAAVRTGKTLLKKSAPEGFYFPFGLGILLLLAYFCFVFTTHGIAIATIWVIFALLAVFELPVLTRKFSLKLLIASPFLLLGFWSCLTPATFFDALVYHLGLPYQYLAIGRMPVIPYHLYSTFPPLDQVLNLLLIGIHAESGIKIFSIVIILGMLHCAAASMDDTSLNNEFLAIPFLCIPALWILVHLVTGDLLCALFFSAGAFLFFFAPIEPRHPLFLSAMLIAFSCWTKWNVLLYLPFLLIIFHKKWSRMISFAAIITLLMLPILIRNYVVVGDPLYPILSKKLGNPLWSAEQQNALQKDSFPHRTRSVFGVLTAPIKLLTDPDNFGTASEIGFTPVFGLLLYPLAAGRRRYRLLLFIATCFFVWVYVFPNFRQFFPVFVLLIPVIWSGWSALKTKSVGLAYGAIVFCIATSLYILMPIYQQLFPLISVKESRDTYLQANVTYYPIARSIEKGRAMLIGETRSAYFRVPVVVSTAYDKAPFWELLHQCGDAECFYHALLRDRITWIVYNRFQYQQRSRAYPLWRLSAKDQTLLNRFVQEYTVPKLRVNGIYLLELKE